MTGKMEDVPPSLKTLAAAFSEHIRASNSLWSVGAVSTLVILSADVTNSSLELFGTKLKSDDFFVIAAFALSLVNIAFCSAQSQALHTARMYKQLVLAYEAELAYPLSRFSKDLMHALYVPAFNRIYPLAHTVRAPLRNFLYVLLKLPTELVFVGAAPFGIWTAAFQMNSATSPLIALGVWAVAAASFLCSLLVVKETVRWALSESISSVVTARSRLIDRVFQTLNRP